MGRDKRRVRLAGKSLLRRVWESAVPLGVPVSVVRHDRMPGHGPLGGVDTAMERFEESVLVFIPCDMPFLETNWLRHLIQVGQAGKFPALVSRVSDRLGFPILVKRSLAGAVRQRLDEGRRSLFGLLEREGCQVVDADPSQEWRFLNINTEEHWSRAVELAAGAFSEESSR